MKSFRSLSSSIRWNVSSVSTFRTRKWTTTHLIKNCRNKTLFSLMTDLPRVSCIFTLHPTLSSTHRCLPLLTFHVRSKFPNHLIVTFLLHQRHRWLFWEYTGQPYVYGGFELQLKVKKKRKRSRKEHVYFPHFPSLSYKSVPLHKILKTQYERKRIFIS